MAAPSAGRRSLLPAIFFLLLLAIPYPAAAQEEEPIAVTAYWELVADTEEAVAALSGDPIPDQRAALADLAARWATVNEVRLADGSLLPVTHAGLVELLRADEPDLAAIGHRLEALQRAQQSWLEPAYDQDEARQATTRLDTILARPEFQWQETEPSLLERIWQWFLRTLFDLLPAGQGNLLFNYLLTAFGALMLLVVLLYAARSLFGSLAAEAEEEGLEHLDTDLTSEEALARAQTFSRGGDYRSAVRYLYLSTLLLLDERGVLRYDRSRTNREYLRSVSGRPEVADTLRRVVEVFDRTWYGYQPLDAESYAAYEAAVNDLQQFKDKA